MIRNKTLTKKLNSILNYMDLNNNFYSSLLLKYEVQVTLRHLWSLKEQNRRYLSYVLSLSPTI